MQMLSFLLALSLQQPADPIDRLVQELNGPAGVRRDLASLALRAYGSAAVEPLKRAGIDPETLPRALADAALLEKLRAIRITLDMTNAPLPAVIDYVRRISGLNFAIDTAAVPRPDEVMVSIKVSDLALEGALKLILAPHGLALTFREGVVTVASHPATLAGLPARAPVRILADSPAARRLVPLLGSEELDERNRAAVGLRRLGFGAEPALWEALRNRDPEIAARAARLIQDLYAPTEVAEPEAHGSLRKPLTFAFENATVLDIAVGIADTASLSLVFNPRATFDEAKTLTLKVSALPAEKALQLLLTQVELRHVAADGAVWITGARSPIVRGDLGGPIWAPAEEARRVEAAVRGLVEADEGRREAAADVLMKLGRPALEPLAQAAELLEGEAARRCRDAFERLAAAEGLWMVDRRTGVDLQPLTDAQKAVLDRKVTIMRSGIPLEETLRLSGLRGEVRARHDHRLRLHLHDLPALPFLKAVTRPYGLDFYMDGETVVVDTAANVRKAVEK